MTDNQPKPVLDGVDDHTLHQMVTEAARKAHDNNPWSDPDDLTQDVYVDLLVNAKWTRFDSMDELEGILYARARRAARAERESWEEFHAQYVYSFEQVRALLKQALQADDPETLAQVEGYADVLTELDAVSEGRRLAILRVYRDGLPASKTEMNQVRDGVRDVFRRLNRKALAGRKPKESK